MATNEESAPEGTETVQQGDQSPSRLALFSVVLRKQLTLLIRYPVNTATRFLTLLVLFGLILFGGEAVVGAAITDSIEGIIVGFFIWTLAIVAFSGLAWNVTREAQWGTLERLFLSPNGFGTVMVVKMVVNVLLSFLWSFSVLLVMMLISGQWLTVDPLTVVPLMVLTLGSISGVGLLCAGLALLYKRIENMFQLVQFGFIGLIAAPVGSYGELGLLPVSQGSYLLRRAMEDGVHLWEFAPGELAVLVATSAGYFVAGYYCLYWSHRRARQKGLMGQY